MANREEPFPLLSSGVDRTASSTPSYVLDPPQAQYTSLPFQYAPDYSSVDTTDMSQYTVTPSQYTPGPSQYTPGPSQYTPGSSQYTPGPSQYAPGPSQYIPEPFKYTPDPPGLSQYKQGPTQYIPGPTPDPSHPPQCVPQYTPGQPQYSPYPQGIPPYTYSSQQQSSNVVVVNSQPSAAESTVVVRSTRDHYLTLSIIMTVVCCFCLGCGWLPLLCTITAIIVSLTARSDERRNDVVSAKRKATVSVCLNITSVIVFVLLIIAVFVAAMVFFVALGKSLSDIRDLNPIPTSATPTTPYRVCSSYISGYYYRYYYC